MFEVRPWPELREHSDVIDLFENTLANTRQTSEELRERAQELRGHASRTNVLGHRTAALAMADRYEQAASACMS